ncbi:MAG: hypothetical protein OES38_12300 [Gammaproteobacteria bacterium]|nr:hypothetical protein [Gammaproteobacteria bacterium]
MWSRFLGAAVLLNYAVAAVAASLPMVACEAEQTGGFHDYPEDDQHYVPALFNPSSFELEENVLFMLNLDPGEDGVDLYLIMRDSDDVESELQCRHVRGASDALGYSCVNTPPSEMLLINGDTLKYTRTAVGGWTFSGPTEAASGDSIFVEYGTCAPVADQPATQDQQ